MKIFIVLLCVCLGACYIPPRDAPSGYQSPSDIASEALKKIRIATIEIQNLALKIIKKNGQKENFEEVLEYPFDYLYELEPEGGQITETLETVVSTVQPMIKRLNKAGISTSTVIAALISGYASDLYFVLSVLVSQIYDDIQIGPFRSLKYPVFRTKPISEEDQKVYERTLSQLRKKIVEVFENREAIEELVAQSDDTYGQIVLNVVSTVLQRTARKIDPSIEAQIKRSFKNYANQVQNILVNVIGANLPIYTSINDFVVKFSSTIGRVILDLAKAK